MSDSAQEAPRRVIEAEVVSEELPRSQADAQPLPPVLAGMLLDLLDFFTAGPIGPVLGPLLGGGGAYLLASLYKLPRKKKILFTIAAGIYCAVPFTAPVPLGTLVGAWLGIQDQRPPK